MSNNVCLTHIPSAYENGNHVWLILVGMFVLHQLQQLAKCFPLLKHTHTHQLLESATNGHQQSVCASVYVYTYSSYFLFVIMF